MKHIFLSLLLLSVTIVSCGQQPEQTNSQELIAAAYGYELTELQFKTYVAFMEQQSGVVSTYETQLALKAQLKEAFLANPETISQELITLETMMNPPTAPKSDAVIRGDMAEGHRIVRELLGNDIGEMQFDTEAANTFRAYMTNTLLTATTGTYDKSPGGVAVRNSNASIEFCTNGTFTEALSGHVGVDVEGGGAIAQGTSYMPGYWEAAALPNGMFIIIMYSTHPRMLEDSPNGILPFVVAKHGIDFVALPGGDLYRRTANYYCN